MRCRHDARWPKARYVGHRRKPPHARQIFASEPNQPVRLVMIGTDFDVRVWGDCSRSP
jgi:hypothetical protein